MQNIKHHCIIPPYFSCFPFSQTSHFCSPLFPFLSHSLFSWFPSPCPSSPTRTDNNHCNIMISGALNDWRGDPMGPSMSLQAPPASIPLSSPIPYIPALLYGSPNLPHKIGFWVFLCYSLKFSPFFFENSMVSWAFLHVLSHWQRLLFSSLQWWMQILMVCNSCKSSHNVLSNSGGGGWVVR